MRRLPSGTTIEFNSIGQQTATRPLVGPATYFAYAGQSLSSPLTRITIPSGLADGDTTVRYTFTYYPDSVVAQLITATDSRRATVLLSGGKVTGIRDPDSSLVQFGYPAGSARISSRTDRRNYTTTYTYDAAAHLIGHSQPVTGGTIAESFQPAESRGVAGTTNSAAQSIDSTYTLLDGARTDVADRSKFWLNKYSAPSRIRNAFGRDTWLYFDATWPALANEVVTPGGEITKAWYNSRGLVDSTKAYNLTKLGDTSPATGYAWNATLALPTAIKSPGGDTTHYNYLANGNLDWVQIGPDTTTRTHFAYYGSGAPVGLYAASSVPGRTERDSVVYDATLGNPVSHKDRTGVWTYTDRDGLGRVRLTRAEFKSGLWRRDSTEYDLADQVIRQVSWSDTTGYGGPSGVSYSFGTDSLHVGADTLYVSNSYDPEGHLLEVARWTHPNPVGLDTTADNYSYDEAGRRTSEWTRTGVDNTYSYDPAGNLIQEQKGGAAETILMQYDEMNHLVRRTFGSKTYLPTSCSAFFADGLAHSGCTWAFPLQTAGHILTIPGDTALFRYDGVGNLVRADNQSARIRRSYSPAGLLVADTLRTRILAYATKGNAAAAVDFNSHVYGIRYGYDVAGRLDSLWHPTNLVAPCSGACPAQGYSYDPLTGRLASIRDVRGKTISFGYTPAGQLQTTSYPGGVIDSVRYDAEGRITHRSVGGGAVWTFISDSLQYDPLGRVAHVDGTTDVNRTVSQSFDNWYAGLGPLVAAQMLYNGTGTPTLEEFRYDGLGNRFWSQRWNVHLGASDDQPSIRHYNYDAEARLDSTTPPTSVVHGWDENYYSYDGEGQTKFDGHYSDADTTPNTSAHYYNGEGKLVYLENQVGYGPWVTGETSNPVPSAVRETYRYDALGRRVLVWALRDTLDHCVAKGCESTVERFVWDGNQILYEVRAPASEKTAPTYTESDSPSGDGDFGAHRAYGRVGYTYAGGIDQPLGLMRMDGNTLLAAIYPHATWRGLYLTATDTVGGLYAKRDSINWPAVSASIDLGAPATPDTAFSWYGSIILAQKDQSGLMYRRNRYYDPASGRFTQPDPIGIAGGLNAYGFANGDPVNYNDPFGLDCRIAATGQACPAPKTDWGAVFKSFAKHAGIFALALATDGLGEFAEFAEAGEAIEEGTAAAGETAEAAGGAEAANGSRWPSTPEEMDSRLGMEGKRVPDTPTTPGRNKVEWRPNSDTKITYEQHPYHPNAPEWHRGPHWHVDTPAARHVRYLPGDPIPQ